MAGEQLGAGDDDRGQGDAEGGPPASPADGWRDPPGCPRVKMRMMPGPHRPRHGGAGPSRGCRCAQKRLMRAALAAHLLMVSVYIFVSF